MDLGITGRVAIVCAASQGLGKAAALALAQEGAHVVICARDRKRLHAAAKHISGAAGNKKVTVVPVPADLTRPRDIKKVVVRTLREFGRVDILVTNAGGPPVGLFMELPDVKWEEGISLNLMSTIRCIRAVLPAMRKQRWGRIINITSLSAKQPVNDLVVSSTIRPGILGLSKVLANQHASEGITVNSVAPGFIMTSRQEELAKARALKKGMTMGEYVQETSKDIPAGRFGTPAELANVIAFLASEKASYITGATISVDGGIIKGLF
jgi:3-oxoacyl-[acyl-carrier protein] reductase